MAPENEQFRQLDEACQRGLDKLWGRAFRYAILATAVPVFAACWWLTSNVARQEAIAEARKAIEERDSLANALKAVLQSQVDSSKKELEESAKFSREKIAEVSAAKAVAIGEAERVRLEVADLRKLVESSRGPVLAFASEIKEKSPTADKLFTKLESLEAQIKVLGTRVEVVEQDLGTLKWVNKPVNDVYHPGLTVGSFLNLLAKHIVGHDKNWEDVAFEPRTPTPPKK